MSGEDGESEYTGRHKLVSEPFMHSTDLATPLFPSQVCPSAYWLIREPSTASSVVVLGSGTYVRLEVESLVALCRVEDARGGGVSASLVLI